MALKFLTLLFFVGNVLAQQKGCGHKPTCTIDANLFEYTWSQTFASKTYTAFTVLTIVNADGGASRVTTITNEPPPGYTPPPTNSKGTRLDFVTYTSHGKVLTATVAFPTIFFDWPDAYVIRGEYELKGSSSGIECKTITGNSTVPISANPQPTSPGNLDPDVNLSADSLGWGYVLDNINLFGVGFLHNIDLLPDDHKELPHSVAKSCLASSAVPANPRFDAKWMPVGVHSTTTEGGAKPKSTHENKPATPVKSLPSSTLDPGEGAAPTRGGSGSDNNSSSSIQPEQTPADGTVIGEGSSVVAGSTSRESTEAAGPTDVQISVGSHRVVFVFQALVPLIALIIVGIW